MNTLPSTQAAKYAKFLPILYWLSPLLIGIIMGLEKDQWSWGSVDISWLLLITLQYLVSGLIALFHNIVQDFTKEIPMLQKRLPQIAIPFLCLIASAVWYWQNFSISHQPPITSLFFLIETSLLIVPLACILGATGIAFGIVTILGMGSDLIKPFSLPFRKKDDSK